MLRIDTSRVLPWIVAPVVVVAVSVALGGAVAARAQAESGDGGAGRADAAVMPEYDDEGRLLLPEDYQQWVFAGSSLGLSYSEGGGGGMEMFHHTLIEPTAYRHFARTGKFREGTMLVLLLHGQGEGEIPQRRGRFASEIHGVEMAVKDSRRSESTWAYYGFGGLDGIRKTAEAFSADSCYQCHAEHAAYDNVFLQFYPLLAEAAPAGGEVRLAMQRGSGAASSRRAVATEEPSGRLAVGGLDPVELTKGREEMGKPEIIAVHGAFRYQFVSEPNRVAFASDPERFSIQNESCPVVPGVGIQPGFFAVHEGRIYAFASQGCVREFEEAPESFLR